MVTGKLPPEAAAWKSGEEVTPIAVYVPEVEPRIEYTIARAGAGKAVPYRPAGGYV